MNDLTRMRDWARRMAETQKPIPMRHPSYLGGVTVYTEAWPTDAERILWRQIADEIDAFIDGDTPPEIDGQDDLFPTTPPTTTDNDEER